SAELATLAHLTAVLNSSLDLRKLLAAFLREAQPLFAFDRAHLALRPIEMPENEWVTEAAPVGTVSDEAEAASAEASKRQTPTSLEIWNADGQTEQAEPETRPLAETGLL